MSPRSVMYEYKTGCNFGHGDMKPAEWQAEAVPYNNDQAYGTIFDRNVYWVEKKALRGKPGLKRK